MRKYLKYLLLALLFVVPANAQVCQITSTPGPITETDTIDGIVVTTNNLTITSEGFGPAHLNIATRPNRSNESYHFSYFAVSNDFMEQVGFLDLTSGGTGLLTKDGHGNLISAITYLNNGVQYLTVSKNTLTTGTPPILGNLYTTVNLYFQPLGNFRYLMIARQNWNYTVYASVNGTTGWTAVGNATFSHDNLSDPTQIGLIGYSGSNQPGQVATAHLQSVLINGGAVAMTETDIGLASDRGNYTGTGVYDTSGPMESFMLTNASGSVSHVVTGNCTPTQRTNLTNQIAQSSTRILVEEQLFLHNNNGTNTAVGGELFLFGSPVCATCTATVAQNLIIPNFPIPLPPSDNSFYYYSINAGVQTYTTDPNHPWFMVDIDDKYVQVNFFHEFTKRFGAAENPDGTWTINTIPWCVTPPGTTMNIAEVEDDGFRPRLYTPTGELIDSPIPPPPAPFYNINGFGFRRGHHDPAGDFVPDEQWHIHDFTAIPFYPFGDLPKVACTYRP